MLIARRSFLSGILALGCGPAIVRAASIMPVKVMPEWDGLTFKRVPLEFDEVITWPPMPMTPAIYKELMEATRKAFMPRLMAEIYSESPTLNLLLYEGKRHGDEARVLKPHQRGRV